MYTYPCVPIPRPKKIIWGPLMLWFALVLDITSFATTVWRHPKLYVVPFVGTLSQADRFCMFLLQLVWDIWYEYLSIPKINPAYYSSELWPLPDILDPNAIWSRISTRLRRCTHKLLQSDIAGHAKTGNITWSSMFLMGVLRKIQDFYRFLASHFVISWNFPGHLRCETSMLRNRSEPVVRFLFSLWAWIGGLDAKTCLSNKKSVATPPKNTVSNTLWCTTNKASTQCFYRWGLQRPGQCQVDWMIDQLMESVWLGDLAVWIWGIFCQRSCGSSWLELYFI